MGGRRCLRQMTERNRRWCSCLIQLEHDLIHLPKNIFIKTLLLEGLGRTKLALDVNEEDKMSSEHLETVPHAIYDFNHNSKGSGQIENLSSYT
jgi:hypothetical protein